MSGHCDLDNVEVGYLEFDALTQAQTERLPRVITILVAGEIAVEQALAIPPDLAKSAWDLGQANHYASYLAIGDPDKMRRIIMQAQDAARLMFSSEPGQSVLANVAQGLADHRIMSQAALQSLLADHLV